jgi:two-component system response regulator AtoC
VARCARGGHEGGGDTVGGPAAGLSKDARESLLNHRGPGNVRELRNAIERAVILCDGGLVTSEHLPIALSSARSRPPAPLAAEPAAPARPAPAAPGAVAPASIPPEGINLEAVEREMIEKAMAQANNNTSEAARLLGLARGQLYSRLKRYGLTRARR